jgi:hypothetical protein
MPFEQLIFSWNAQRPKRGMFIFWGRLHDRKTKQWLDWHKLATWGNHEQRTVSNARKKSKHHFVRLEMDQPFLADGFEMHVQCKNGAKNTDLQLLSVTTAHRTQLHHETNKDFMHLPSIVLSGIPQISQKQLDHPDCDRACSPVAFFMLCSSLSAQSLDINQFISGVYDDGLSVFGSWPCNIAHGFVALDGMYGFAVQRLHSFSTLHKYVERGTPVPVSIRGTLSGAPQPYPDGHFVLVVGYNADTQSVMCHDPAIDNEDILIAYPLNDFLSAWERSCRLAYVVVPPQRR